MHKTVKNCFTLFKTSIFHSSLLRNMRTYNIWVETVHPRPYTLTPLSKTYCRKDQPSHSAQRTKSEYIFYNLFRTSKGANGQPIGRSPLIKSNNNQWRKLPHKRSCQRSSSVFFGRAASRRAIAQYLSGRGEEHCFHTTCYTRPERILAHIPRALRLVYSADKSGDHISTARP